MPRRFLSLTLTMALQTSLCTGGVLSLFTYGIASTLVTYDDSAPMSYAAIEYLSCKQTKHDAQYADTGEVGCEGSDTCVQQAFETVRERVSTLLATTQAVMVPQDVIRPVIARGPPLAGRLEPVYPQARLIASITVKRE